MELHRRPPTSACQTQHPSLSLASVADSKKTRNANNAIAGNHPVSERVLRIPCPCLCPSGLESSWNGRYGLDECLLNFSALEVLGESIFSRLVTSWVVLRASCHLRLFPGANELRIVYNSESPPCSTCMTWSWTVLSACPCACTFRGFSCILQDPSSPQGSREVESCSDNVETRDTIA